MDSSPYTLQWAAPFFPSHEGSGPQSKTGFLGISRAHNPTASLSVQPFLQGSLLWQTDRRTDRPLQSVCNNTPHLLISVMRPNNNTGISMSQQGHNFRHGSNTSCHYYVIMKQVNLMHSLKYCQKQTFTCHPMTGVSWQWPCPTNVVLRFIYLLENSYTKYTRTHNKNRRKKKTLKCMQ